MISHRIRHSIHISLIIMGIILSSSGCNPTNQVGDLTATQAEISSPSPYPTQLPTFTPLPGNRVWVNPTLPAFVRNQIVLPPGFIAASTPTESDYQYTFQTDPSQAAVVYLLCAPFYTLRDQVPLSELMAAWKSDEASPAILVENETLQVFSILWGTPGDSVRPIDTYDSIQVAPNDDSTWILLPFQNLRPDWKLIWVDGVNPLNHSFKAPDYPLSIHFGFDPEGQTPSDLIQTAIGVRSNFDPDKLSVVVMTGTTALTRGTAHQMDINGVTWPGKDIRAILRDADITHISNEVSFYKHCSKGNPNERSLMFCSRPEYLGLLTDVGADVVELSGNHNLDYGKQPYRDSLAMYAQNDIQVYAGGLTEADARKPAMFENHGNKFAFLGCNFVGPRFAMATENSMGAAHCDFDYFTDQITSLRKQGYLPIFTFQYSEYTIHKPGEHQERDYRRMADAGAVVVSGSQAHYPQVMTIHNGSFIHYGLGNLFFDQMDKPVKGTREEFIDRHYFYDGRYIGTELITALLEDAARPRPMTTPERIDFLTRIFIDALSD